MTWPRRHARLCASLTAASSIGHLLFAASGQHGVWLGVPMVALAAVCLPCAAHIWRLRHPGSLQKVAGCAVVMAVVHSALLLAPGGAGHSHSSGPTTSAQPGADVVILGIIALEIATAMLAATLTARLRCAAQFSFSRSGDLGGPTAA